MEKKEQHVVGINGLNVDVKILVNGILAFSKKLKASVSIPGFPLTSYMTNGDNTIEIFVVSIPNEYNNNSCKFNFGHVKDMNVSQDIAYDKKFECGDALKNKGIENFTYNVKTNLSFASPWLSGKKFEDSEETRKQLLDKYQEMQEIFVFLDDVRIKNFLKYKFEMDSTWMNKAKKDVEKEYIEFLKSVLEDPNVKLLPVLEKHKDDRKITLELSKDEHLARLIIDSGAVRPPVQWYNYESKITTTFALWFMMTQDGYLIPIL